MKKSAISNLKSKLVVIGCSLGGLHALRVVLGALPSNYPLPVVIVQHRSGVDILSALLLTHCELPVKEAEDKEPLLAGQAYLAPDGYHLLVERGSLALSTEPSVNYALPSIDVLFESAAGSYGAGAVGVLLTGANYDGAQGLAAIKGAGGLTIAQNPASAEAPSMPAAAIALKAADIIMPLCDIGKFLADLGLQISAIRNGKWSENE